MGRPPKYGQEEQEQLFQVGLKRCTKCGKVKPFSEFYKRSDDQSKHKHTSHCKTCTIARTHAYHQTPKGREVARAAIRKYNKTEKGRAARRRWMNENLLRMQAKHAVGHAVENGSLERPENCSQCGCKCKPEGHHYLGYEPEHWLDVQWLCRPCHFGIHGR